MKKKKKKKNKFEFVLITSLYNTTNRNWTFCLVRYFAWKLESVADIFWMIVSGNIFLLLSQPRSLQT